MIAYAAVSAVVAQCLAPACRGVIEDPCSVHLGSSSNMFSCRRSSVVEHIHGKDGVGSSILPGGSIIEDTFRPSSRCFPLSFSQGIFAGVEPKEGALEAARTDGDPEKLENIVLRESVDTLWGFSSEFLTQHRHRSL